MIVNIKKNSDIANYFNLTYNVTRSCNYHCPYCMQLKKPIKDTNPKLIELISKQINKTIKDLKQQGKNIDFHLIGGEVSIYDIKNLILKNIDLSNIYRFSMVTNLSRSAEYYDELFKYLTDNNVEIRIKASFHPTETSKEDFINKLLKLKKYNIIASLLLTQVKFYDVYDFYNELVQNGINTSVSVERVLGYPISETLLTENEKKLIQKDKCRFHVVYDNGNKDLLTKFELLNKIETTKNYLCDINLSKLIIGPKGEIRNSCSQQKNNKTIFNFKPNYEFIKCNTNYPCTLYAINELKYEE